MDEKLFLYIDILGFSDIVENGERIDALFAEIDQLNVHTDSGFRTIVFSDTILVYANDGWMAEDALYLSNIHTHMNDGALPEAVRAKYAAT